MNWNNDCNTTAFQDKAICLPCGALIRHSNTTKQTQLPVLSGNSWARSLWLLPFLNISAGILTMQIIRPACQTRYSRERLWRRPSKHPESRRGEGERTQCETLGSQRINSNNASSHATKSKSYRREIRNLPHGSCSKILASQGSSGQCSSTQIMK